MRNRIMRAIVFFDLPNTYSIDKRNYNRFRKFLINDGYLMLQESVYSKLILNEQQGTLLVNRLKKNSPSKGIIQILIITEKQYSKMEYIIGSSKTKIVNSEDRLVIL